MLKKKIKIGELLIERGIITADQLEQALGQQWQSGKKLGRILVEMGFVDEDIMLGEIAHQLAIDYIDLKKFSFDTKLVNRLPEMYARRFLAIPLYEQEGTLYIGMSDPMDIFAHDELSRYLHQPIEVCLVKEEELLATLDLIYRRTEDIATYAEELEEEITEGQFNLEDLTPNEEDDDAPVVKLLKSIFEDAVQVRASDIHIEPDESVLRIRQRVDGVLQEQIVKEKKITSALVLRLKLMAGLNISEKRLPQDGRFSLIVKSKKLDVRVSTMPVEYGESVVMRLLDQSGSVTSLNNVGMPEHMLAQFRRLIHLPHGLILVTGPTGSGKTTTLYGALQELNQVGSKIITVEDPVEYRLSRINQVQVNPKIDLSFARVLRAALRQDPDIILVGEIRDAETAEIALRAAMTGHLVLSTLHTNDAVSSAMRLVDMGAEGFLAAASLKAVMAQRLVRRLCDNCTEDYTPDRKEKGWLESVLGKEAATGLGLKKPVGCHRCNNTGYRGRIGVFELLVLNEHLSDALRREDSAEFVRAAKNVPGYQPLVKSALDYAIRGITSLDEVFRVSEQIDESSDYQEIPQSA